MASLSGSVTAVSADFTISDICPVDWAVAYAESPTFGWNRKDGGGSQITLKTGANADHTTGGWYSDWDCFFTGGTPMGSSGAEFKYVLTGDDAIITFPADTNERVVRIYYRCDYDGSSQSMHIEAHLSDSSAADWVPSNVSVGANAEYGYIEITYAAASADQTLTVTLTDVNTVSVKSTGILAAGIVSVAAPTTPTAPTAGSASSISQTSATANWTDASGDETGFKVEYATSPYSSWTAASGSPASANATSLSITGLTANTTYKFRVCATNSNGDSSYSTSAEFTTLPNAPTAPTSGSTTSISASGATINWTDNSSNETGFKVQYAVSPYSSWTTASESPAAAGATSLAVTGLSPNTTYKARIAATNTGGDSSWVETATFTTLQKMLKIAGIHPSAAGVTSVSGIVWAAQGGAIAGAEIGEFSGASFEADLEEGAAVMYVPVTEFGGTGLSTSDTPVALVRTATYTTGIVSCTVVEA